MADADNDKDVLVLGADEVPQSTPTPSEAEPKAVRRMGVPAAVGGAIAALFGFGLAQVVPNGWPLQGTDALRSTLSEQASTLATQQSEIDRLTAALAEVQARPTADATLADRLATIEAAIPAPYDPGTVTDRLDVIDQRLAAIESMPTDGSGASPAALAAQAAALAALQTEVAALRVNSGSAADIEAATAAAEARLAEAEARAAALGDAAEADAARALAATSLRQIEVALEVGGPFASALPAFDAARLPAVLADNAATGLPTLTDLQAAFPDAARAALEASLRADMGEGWTERVTSFLRTQTGARSLTPREGNDPDAILSRAEAALAEGRIADSMAEIATLPAEGLAAMTSFTDAIALYLAGQDAMKTLRAATGGE